MIKRVRLLWKLSPVQRLRFWPCLTSLVLTVLGLQLLHLALLSRLQGRDARGRDLQVPVGRHLQGRVLGDLLLEMEDRVRNCHRFDRSGTYFLVENFLTSEHALVGKGQFDVSVVTQSSSEHLGNLVELSQRWTGPVSVSVFTYDSDLSNAVSRLLHLHFCHEHIRRHVSFHLIYPISRAPKHLEGFSDMKVSCADFKLTNNNIHNNNNNKNLNIETNLAPESVNYAMKDLEYPNNLLRNVAINYAQTPYIFMIDIDFLPSENLRLGFQTFMSSSGRARGTSGVNSSSESGLDPKSSPLAFVVPAFEIQESVPVPKNKDELLRLWGEGVVRPFYGELCPRCQEATDYSRWKDLGGQGTVRLGYSVQREGIWEPFYIAQTSLPLYDERFKQYGYNRISQICEMHVVGFQFYVLDNAFIVHRGFKVKDAFHGSKGAENARNKLLFQTFQGELKVKHPESTRRC